jgi:hypothetical protein
MSGAREQILDRLRESLGNASDRNEAVEERLSQRPRGPLPAPGRKDWWSVSAPSWRPLRAA